MHEEILQQTIETVRKRLAEGDLPTVRRDSREHLENAVVQLRDILIDILVADERGQGLPYTEAMERARRALGCR